MDFTYIKILLLLNGWLVEGSPLAMLQHATSSQSFVFHPAASTNAPATAVSSSGNQYGGNNDQTAQYEYKYEVSDLQTGDRKTHGENREGNRVRGIYTLYEPDGALRTVEYTADGTKGFNAIVRREDRKGLSQTRIESPFKSYANNPFENFNSSEQPDLPSDRSYLTPNQSNENPGYPPAGSYNSGFSVNHVKKGGEHSPPPY